MPSLGNHVDTVFIPESVNTSTTLRINGGDLHLDDGKKALFGQGDDLQIYHDGSNSYIEDEGEGNLRILSNKTQIRNAANSVTLADFTTTDNSVILYKGGGARLRTTTDGVTVTGTALATALSTGAAGTGINISTGTITGPSTITIDPSAIGDDTGLVIVKGDFQVDGTTTTINSTTLTVDDKNIVLASGAADSAAADGAGITIDGANESLTWIDSNKSFRFSTRLAIGNSTSTTSNLRLSKNLGGESLTTYYAILSNGIIQPDVTGTAHYNFVQAKTADNSGTAYTIGNISGYTATAADGAISEDSTITNLTGFLVKSSWTVGTNNYGFRSQIADAANRWNVYMDGTAPNYFAGKVGIGTDDPSSELHIYRPTGQATTLKIEGGSPELWFKNVDETPIFRQIINANGWNVQPGTGSVTSPTWASVALAVDESGNVGIGTVSPSDKLHVAGSIKITAGAPIIKLAETGVTGNPSWWIVQDAGNFSLRNNNTSPYAFQVATKGANKDTTDFVRFGGDTIVDALTLTAHGTNPTYLDLKGNNANARMRYFEGATERWNIGYDTGADAFTFYDAQNSAFSAVFKDGGNVGIGANDPSERLEVDGVILSSGPVVDTVWYKETWPAYNETTATLAGNDLGTWTLTGGTLLTGTPADHYEVDLARLPSGLKAVRWVGATAVSYFTSPTIDLSDFRTNEKITTVNQTGSLADRSVSDSRIYLTMLLAAQSMDTNAEHMEVQLSNDDGVTFHEHQAFVWQDNSQDNDDITDTTWRKVVIDISEFVYKPSTAVLEGFKIRFKGTGEGTGDSYGVSNIYIHDAPIPNKLKAKTLKLGDASLSNDLDYDEYLEIVSSVNTFKGLVLNGDPAAIRDNYVGVNGADSLVLAADELNAGNDSRIDFRIDAKVRMKLYTSTNGGASEAHLQLIGHATPTDRSNWRISAHDDGTKGYFAISDYSGGNWNENLTIHENGNVGIGTNNPSSLLHLAANAPYITFEDEDNNQDWQIQATAWFALRNQTTSSELLRVTHTGQVGIGTNSIARGPLHIHQDTTGDTQIHMTNSETGTSSSDGFTIFTGASTGSHSGFVNREANARIRFLMHPSGGSDVTDQMVLLADGNLGLGISDPTEKLHMVGGKILLTGANLAGTNHSAIRSEATIDDVNRDMVFNLRLVTTMTDNGTTNSDREQGGVYNLITNNATGGNTSHEHRVYGVWNDINNYGDPDQLYGTWNGIDSYHTSGTISSLYGSYSLVQVRAAGNVSNIYANYSIAQATTGSTGTVGKLVGVRGRANLAGTSAVSLTDQWGVWGNVDNDANVVATGVVSCFYGSYDTVGDITTPYGIYMGTANLSHYLSGVLGVGNASNAKSYTSFGALHIGDETTAATTNDIVFGKRVTTSQANLPRIGHCDILGTATNNDLGLNACSSGGGIGFFTGNGVGGYGSGSNALRMIIEAGGDVGIGTNNPTSKLEVYGNARFKATDGSHGIEFYPDVGGLGYQRIISYNRTSSAYEDLSIGVDDFIVTNGASSEALRITSGGNVGIGTNNPANKLDVVGNAFIGAGADITPGSTGAGQIMIKANGYTPYIAADATAMYVGHNSSSRELRFQTNEATRMYIAANGSNVGIGTTSATSYALSVRNVTAPTTTGGVFIDCNDWSTNGSENALRVDVDSTSTSNLSANRSHYGIHSSVNLRVPSNASTATGFRQTVIGGYMSAQLDDTSASDGKAYTLYGAYGRAKIDGINASNVRGVYALAQVGDNASGTSRVIDNLYGVYGYALNDGNQTTITNAYAVYAHCNQDDTGGAMTNGYGVYSRVDRDGGTGGTGYAYRGAFEGTWSTKRGLWITGDTENSVDGSFSKGSGSFKIPHPLPEKNETHHLVHSFVESPQANNIYRGKVTLVNGSATINLDTESTMTEGTFVLLNRDIHCFTSNESDWDAVRGSVSGNILTIECQNPSSTATVAWLVIGERHDKHMYDTGWTDDDGKVIVEPLQPEPEPETEKPEMDDEV